MPGDQPAALRVSSPSQPNSLIVVRYSSRNNTIGDHVMTTEGCQNRKSHLWRFLARHSHREVTASGVPLNGWPSWSVPLPVVQHRYGSPQCG